MADGDFVVRIWGARGSLPACSGQASSFGCATPCVEVRCGNRTFCARRGLGQLPARTGTGRGQGARVRPPVHPLPLRPHRGAAVLPAAAHQRLDRAHLVGTPGRAHDHRGNDHQLHERAVLSGGAELFQRRPEVQRFRCRRGDLGRRRGDDPHHGLNHPGGAIGYRFEYRGRSFCLITDTEHVPGEPDEAILAFIAGADAVVYDSAYCDEEFKAYRGYGHSTWQEGVRLCNTAEAGLLLAFHHQPEKNDAALEAIDVAMRKARPRAGWRARPWSSPRAGRWGDVTRSLRPASPRSPLHGRRSGRKKKSARKVQAASSCTR
jgi:hypothetical protein